MKKEWELHATNAELVESKIFRPEPDPLSFS